MAVLVVVDDKEAWQGTAVDALRQAAIAAADSLPKVCKALEVASSALPVDRICPLTFDIPDHFSFPGQAIFQACRDRDGLRDRVRKFGYGIGTGSHWLPIVHTLKGTLYGEAITTVAASYQQPLHLSDRLRQPLYALGQILMRELAAPPSVYLLQFEFVENLVMFDRLWPFPAAPAMASIDVQRPNLYECHWRCLSHQAIVDLTIAGTAEYRMLDVETNVL